MAIEIEIRDGSPHWYLSPDIWMVKDPNDETESAPVAGTPFFLKAKVRNGGSNSVANATVKFYWANPSVGFNRNTANYIGQSFVSLGLDQVQDVLCLVPWIPVYLNNGHECVLAEAYHQNDPLSNTVDFNVPTVRHVAQRNLSVEMAINAMFHMNFEIHNASRIEQKFDIKAEQIGIKDISEFDRIIRLTKGKKEGSIKNLRFSDALCLEDNMGSKDHKNITENGIPIEGSKTKHMAVNGTISGDFVLLMISQSIEEKIIGGLAVLIINDKKEKG